MDVHFIDFIKIEENVAREVPGEVNPSKSNFLTHCPVYQMVFGVVRCFQGLKQASFLSESELK